MLQEKFPHFVSLLRTSDKKILMLTTLANKLRLESDYSKRIKFRHATFWNDPNAENVRNTILNASVPLDRWKDVENWQRKLSNKYNSREFAKMHRCKVPDLFWRGRDIENIDFEKLPECYVIRPTIGHSCHDVYLFKKGYNFFDKKKYTTDNIKTNLSKALAENPRLEFLIEEFITNENGEHTILNDYKIFAFNGNIAAILVINRLSPKTGFQSCYTEEWEPIKPLVSTYPVGPRESPPKCLTKMIAAAKNLSKAYQIFVRIDFYASAKGAIFGEFSPTPIIGNCSTPFASKLFKNYWDTYCYKMI